MHMEEEGEEEDTHMSETLRRRERRFDDGKAIAGLRRSQRLPGLSFFALVV